MSRPEKQGEQVIARAFRRSLLTLIVVVLISGIVLFFFRRPADVAELPDTVLTEPAAPTISTDPTPPLVRFVNVAEASGATFKHVSGASDARLLPETMGGGIAILDFDNDGAQDLLFVGARDLQLPPEGQPSSLKLLRNSGNWQFEDVTASMGLSQVCYCMGVAVGDVNADGRLDLYITALGPNLLYLNTSRGFVLQPAALGAAGAVNDWSTSASFVDVNGDGWLDLFVANYVTWSERIDYQVDYRLAGIGRAYGPPTQYAGADAYLFINEAGEQFTDATQSAGLSVSDEAQGQPVGKGLGVLAWDWDGDGDQDLFLANDTTRNFLFENAGDGRFTEVGAATGVAFDNSGKATGAMGVDILEAQGVLTLAVANFANEMTSFYVRHDADGFFTDEAVVSGVGADTRRALSFGLFFFDYDLDGRADLFQANGHVEPLINQVQPSQRYAQPAQLFWQCGLDCRRQFTSVQEAGDLLAPATARGAAYGDLDGDGDLDLVVVQVGRDARVFRNDQNTRHHWLAVQLKQTGPNGFAYGAKVGLSTDSNTQTAWMSPTRSYLSHMALPLHFGLGESDGPVSATVVWPDGESQVFDDIAVDRFVTLNRSE